MERRVTQAVREHFRPELLNRIDEIVIFHGLTKDDLKRIVLLQVEGLRAMLAERELGLELSEKALGALVEEGFDPHYGARPLKRTLQRRVQNPLAMKLLQGEFKPGQTVRVEFEKGEFAFKAAAAMAKAEAAAAR
jgi:ATP-dependent Clp protease ATP-binding subunit ClpB